MNHHRPGYQTDIACCNYSSLEVLSFYCASNISNGGVNNHYGVTIPPQKACKCGKRKKRILYQNCSHERYRYDFNNSESWNLILNSGKLTGYYLQWAHVGEGSLKWNNESKQKGVMIIFESPFYFSQIFVKSFTNCSPNRSHPLWSSPTYRDRMTFPKLG